MRLPPRFPPVRSPGRSSRCGSCPSRRRSPCWPLPGPRTTAGPGRCCLGPRPSPDSPLLGPRPPHGFRKPRRQSPNAFALTGGRVHLSSSFSLQETPPPRALPPIKKKIELEAGEEGLQAPSSLTTSVSPLREDRPFRQQVIDTGRQPVGCGGRAVGPMARRGGLRQGAGGAADWVEARRSAGRRAMVVA